MHEQTIDVAGVAVFHRRVPAAHGEVLYLHSVPTSCDDWLEMQQRTGGLAPDLPGFGRSGKAAHQDYSLPAYATFVEGLLETFGIGAVTLVGHGWGAAVALSFAQRHPPRVRAIVIIDGVPLLPGFQWRGLPRWLRRRGAGELIMGSVSRRRMARTLRRASATDHAWPDVRLDAVWEQFDQGTQRAILRLHRSVDERGLAAAGGALDQVRAPALVVWGEQDPWLAPSLGDGYGAALPDATVERVPEAGHWPWLDQPGVVERVAAFVEA